MKDFIKASHVNNALQVIKHMNDGIIVSDACRECGLARSTFYNIMKRNPEAIGEIQEIIDAKNHEQLGLVILSKTEILRKVIEAGLVDATKPKDRLAIFVKLNELVDSSTKDMGMDMALRVRCMSS